MNGHEEAWNEWWDAFYSHVEGTIDRNTARIVYDYMNRQQPRVEVVTDWAEHWLRVQKSLDTMFNAAAVRDMKLAGQQAMKVRDAACKLCGFFNERMFEEVEK